jgi:hypothetical protein
MASTYGARSAISARLAGVVARPVDPERGRPLQVAEDDALFESDLDVQTYVQLMLSAKQAAATRRPLWVAA